MTKKDIRGILLTSEIDMGNSFKCDPISGIVYNLDDEESMSKFFAEVESNIANPEITAARLKNAFEKDDTTDWDNFLTEGNLGFWYIDVQGSISTNRYMLWTRYLIDSPKGEYIHRFPKIESAYKLTSSEFVKEIVANLKQNQPKLSGRTILSYLRSKNLTGLNQLLENHDLEIQEVQIV